MNKALVEVLDFRGRFSPQKVSPGSFKEPADIVLFLHIPKTAGMSVGRAIRSHFDVFHPVSWENTGHSFRSKSKQALYYRTKNANLRQVLMGHFTWAEVMFWRNQELPIKCATVIRDPLQRFVSNYNYNRSEKHPHNADFKSQFPTLESYAQKLTNDYQLTRMVGQYYSFEHALEKVTKYYSFVGITEKLGASLEHFSVSHGLNGKVEEYNENSGPMSEQTVIPDSVVNLVGEKSANDQRLHDLCLSLYKAA